MKALVTGAAGVFGQHLVSHLLQAGYDVSGLDCTDGIQLATTIYKVDSNKTVCGHIRYA